MITAIELRERLQYDPNTGRWVWLKTPRRGYEGSPAGSLDSKGYWIIKIGISGEQGIYRHSQNDRWIAQHENIYIGSYKTIEEAVAARDAFIVERNVA